MCGISGLYSYHSSQIDKNDFISFVDSLTHRGPDGRGIYQDLNEPLWLGHRRLKILDLSPLGSQPMSYSNQRYQIVFNGEIYNFLELKKELKLLGYSFHSDTDTEVILAAFAEWGEACQKKFNGMWAFAIWDTQTKQLFLSRDRFGVKPLYYYLDSHHFAFASEVKSFLFLSEFDVSIDERYLTLSLQNPNFVEATEDSLLNGVKKLRAGHSATFCRKSGLSIKKWWNTLDHLCEVPSKFPDQVEMFRNLFEDACRIRMRSDIPLGSAVSGGLDSSSVLSMITRIGRQTGFDSERLSPEWRSVFTALFPGTSQDESSYAKEIIKYTNSRPFFCSIDPSKILENLDDVLYHLEEIFELPIGPWMVYRECRKQGIAISIDGHGADELLGGYHHHVEMAISQAFFPQMNLSKALDGKSLLQSMYPPDSPLYPSMKQILKRSIKERLKMYPPWILNGITRLLGQKNTKPWLRNLIPLPGLENIYTRLSNVDQLLYHDFHQNTLPTILRNFDRCSMAHGVEIRAPFLDWRLVCYCFSLPTDSKIGGGVTKRILREAMRTFLPESIRLRGAKVGFTNPLIEWFKGDLKSYIFDSIRSQSFLQSPIWDGTEIARHVEDSYQRNDFVAARRCWEFIQADHLIRIFESKRRTRATVK